MDVTTPRLTSAETASASTTDDERHHSDLVGLSTDGAEVWRVRHAGATTSEPVGVVVDAEGRVLATGMDSYEGAEPHWWLDAYTDGAFDFLSVSDRYSQVVGAVVATGPSGGVVTLVPFDASPEVHLIRIEANGVNRWQATLTCGRLVTSDETGTVWAMGTRSNGKLERCAVDANGTELGTSPFGVADGFPTALTMPADGDTLIAGYTTGATTNMQLDRRAPTGELRWRSRRATRHRCCRSRSQREGIASLSARSRSTARATRASSSSRRDRLLRLLHRGADLREPPDVRVQGRVDAVLEVAGALDMSARVEGQVRLHSGDRLEVVQPAVRAFHADAHVEGLQRTPPSLTPCA